ncbi:hypothetical protein AURDEDRAFT_128798 [Auricularia subglabra TFB-10046 SS5]|nr:hypothetical protein AURDEDRAFT_128798 [Auricularia subglabra TFB-10046 SS5]
MQETVAETAAALPVELLAKCFLFLPEHLFDRLPVLHVSHTWRAVAFAFPDIWSRICLSDNTRKGHLLLDLVLSSTRDYPFELLYRKATGAESPDAMARVVAKYLHRIRGLLWTAVEPRSQSFLDSPAPLLEYLSGRLQFPISHDLLGGIPGRLRSLELSTLELPPSCPALQTVRHLKAATTPMQAHSEFLHLLFKLCPNLESLDLDLRIPRTALFPQGPAPRSLTRLRLNDVDVQDDRDPFNLNVLDLIDLCAAWQVIPGLKELELCSFVPGDRVMDISPIIAGALELSVIGVDSEGSFACITARYARDKQHTLRLHHKARAELLTISRLLVASQPSLLDLERLTITSELLQLFCADGGALPSVRALRIVVYPQVRSVAPIPSRRRFPRGAGAFSGHAASFPWSHLSMFLPTHMPQLATLAIDVQTRFDEGSDSELRGKTLVPKESDALALVTALSLGGMVSPSEGVAITIHGFSATAAASGATAPHGGLAITFAWLPHTQLRLRHTHETPRYAGMPAAKKSGEQIQPPSPPAPPPLMPKKGKPKAAPEKAPEKPKGKGGANGKKKGAASGQGNGDGVQNPPLRRSTRNQKEPLDEVPPPPPLPPAPPRNIKAQKKGKNKPLTKKKPQGKNVPAPEPDLVDEDEIEDDGEDDEDEDEEDEPELAPPPPKSKKGKKASAKKHAPPMHADDVFADTTNKKKGTKKKKVAFSDAESDDGRSSRFSEARQSDDEGMEVDNVPLTPVRPVVPGTAASADHLVAAERLALIVQEGEVKRCHLVPRSAAVDPSIISTR